LALNPNIMQLFKRLPLRKGRVLTLGEQKVNSTSAKLAEILSLQDLRTDVTRQEVFEVFGFEDVQSLDVSA